MGSNWPGRLMLWLVTLFSPAFLAFVYNSRVVFFAPLWLLAFYGEPAFFVFLGFFAPPLHSGIFYLAGTIFLTLPVLLTTRVLELTPRHRSWLEYARTMILVYPALVVSANVLLFVMFPDMLAVPVPLAALVQYLRYRQLRQALGAPVSAVTETTPTV